MVVGGVSAHRHPLGSVAGTVNDTGTPGMWWCQPPHFQLATAIACLSLKTVDLRSRSQGDVLEMCPRPLATSRIGFSVRGLPNDIRLVAAGACWSNTGNPGLQGLRPCTVAADPILPYGI